MKNLMIAAIVATGLVGAGFAAQAHRPEPNPTPPPPHRPELKPVPAGCEQSDDWRTCFWKQMQQMGGSE